jgi:uncharacterized protein YodC (DUF2158 family)
MANNEKKIQIGDLVCIPSSPDVPMTVEAVDDLTGEVTCVWLDGKYHRKAAVFKINTLRPFQETCS